MPRLDGTGPWGYGPRTGRGLGSCCGYGSPYGRRFFSQKEEKELLEEEKEVLEKELEAVKERLEQAKDRQ